MQRRLPAELERLARAEGVDTNAALLVAQTDLNLSGAYESVYLVVEHDRLTTIGAPANGGTATRVAVAREEIHDIGTRPGVGGGFLEAVIEDAAVEILAYSNRSAPLFQRVAAKLQAWVAGDPLVVGPEDREEPDTCPACGIRLEAPGEACRRCLSPGSVLGRVLRLMRPYAGRAALMMGLVLISIGVELLPPQLIKVITDRVLAPGQAGNPVLPEGEAIALLVRMVALLLGAYLVDGLVQSIQLRLSSAIGTQVTYDLRSKLFRHLMRLSISYYDRYSTGQLMSRVVQDTEQLKGLIVQATSGFVAQLIKVVAVGLMLFSLNWQLALVTLVPAPFVVVAAVFFWKRIYPRYYRIWDARSKLNGALNSILNGIRVVKAFGQERREVSRFHRTSGYLRDSFRRVEYMTASFQPAMAVLFQLGGILVWFIGGRRVLNDLMTLGTLMAFLQYLSMFYVPLRQLTRMANWLTSFLSAAQRAFEILDTQPLILESTDTRPIPAQPAAAVKFDHVEFSYERDERVINDLSFEVRPGEHLGVVGKSGSGKTTLINLIARFYDVTAGGVSINGVDVRNLPLPELRRFVGVVLQESFLFRGTIYDNLTYGNPDVSFEAVVDAAKAANAHEFIMQKPLGYDTYIGERGAGLSGGQRQRVSIARALLYDPRLLILDEATSSVDTESEHLIKDALDRVTEGRTTIAIAHPPEHAQETATGSSYWTAGVCARRARTRSWCAGAASTTAWSRSRPTWRATPPSRSWSRADEPRSGTDRGGVAREAGRGTGHGPAALPGPVDVPLLPGQLRGAASGDHRQSGSTVACMPPTAFPSSGAASSSASSRAGAPATTWRSASCAGWRTFPRTRPTWCGRLCSAAISSTPSAASSGSAGTAATCPCASTPTRVRRAF